MSSPIYQVRDVTLNYVSVKKTTTEALKNINISIEEGEFFTVIGPSGCGKTTLLKLMSGLILPSEGEIRFKDKKIVGPAKGGIGMAFQDSLLLPWRTVIDNVLLPIEILGEQKEKYYGKAQDILRTVGLDGFEAQASWQLSGGMKQRASLCRALITDPGVLLLDEPFGALDAFTREELWLVLQKLHAKTKCTIVLVTHQLNESVFLSDRVIVLSSRPGRVVYEEKISLPKPRELELKYTKEFTNYEYSLRTRIEK